MSRFQGWLRFFRVVNLPTVPGDVLVGAAIVLSGAAAGTTTAVRMPVAPVAAASCGSVALYLFGLADNDIVGAKTDVGRPIAEGLVSLRAARVARGLCLLAVLIVGAVADLPPVWWVTAFVLALVIVAYNRTKSCLLMGCCRGLDVLCGGAAILTGSLRGVPPASRLALAVAAAVFTAYVAGVTKYSEGEEADPAKRRRVGFLVGATVYLQLVTLLAVYLTSPTVVARNLLLAGAVLLVLLRFLKRLLPKVSGS